jgi:hypothetical protein
MTMIALMHYTKLSLSYRNKHAQLLIYSRS